MKTIPRRLAWTIVAFSVFGAFSLASAPGSAAPGSKTISIGQAQLQDTVARKFPYQQRVAEVLELQVLAPRLGLLPASNRLSTDLDLEVTEFFMGQRYSGTMAMDYGLRFEPSDKSVRMTGVRVNSVNLANVPEPYRSLITQNAPRLAERLFNDYALHRFSEQDLSLVSGLGLVPGNIQVTARGLNVTLVPASLSGQPLRTEPRPSSSLPRSSGVSL